MKPAPRTRLVAGLAAIVVLAVVAIVAIMALLPPAPRTEAQPGGGFVAARAFQDVETIGSAVHVAGSGAAAAIRGHIVDTLTDLGLKPQVREGIGATAALGGPAMAYVRNVVAEIPGSNSTGRLILMAHYDSVQVSYGANDDGSGVATLLEVARALTHGPGPRNDVILLFTDAEEACLCGSESFVHSDPLGVAGGVVLNFESRGANGPSVMFETAAGNANLVAQYADAVPYPVATSMAVEVYRILPNDTDFTPFRESGRFTGLNSAYIDGSAVYHSPQDRPEYMNHGTLQQHGDNALALARKLGFADLGPLSRPAAHDATYFPVLGSLVTYPGTWVWVIAALAVLAVVAAGFVARRRGIAGWGRISAGFGLMLVPLIGAAVVAQLFWALLVAIRPGYGEMIDPWDPTWFRFAVCSLVVLVVVGWYALWRKRLGAWVLAIGALGWLAVIGVGMAAFTPGGSYLAALPALVGALMAVAAMSGRAWWIQVTSGAVSGAVAVVILVPTVFLFFPALGLAAGAAGAFMATMLAFVLLPVFEFVHPAIPDRAHSLVSSETAAGGEVPPDAAVGGVTLSPDATAVARGYRRRYAVIPTAIAALLAVTFTGIGLATDHFDHTHPEPTQLMYVLDADTGQALWASQQSGARGWLAGYVHAERNVSAEFPALHGTLLTGPAEAAALGTPQLTVDTDSVDENSRTFTITVHPRPDARFVQLDAPGITVRSALVHAGNVERPIEVDRSGFSMLFHAPPPEGIRVTLTVDGTGPVTFRVEDGSDGLTGLPGFTPRPADVGVQGSHTSELVLVAHSVII